GARDIEQRAVEVEQAVAGVVIGESVVFGKVADAFSDRGGAGRLAEQARLAVRGADDAEQQLDHRGLAGAVLAQAAEDLATVDVQSNAAEGLDAAIALDEVLDLDDRLGLDESPRRF